MDINCNVGGSAIAAISRGLMWIGFDRLTAMRTALVPHVLEQIQYLATSSDCFQKWFEGMLIVVSRMVRKLIFF